MVQTLPLKLVVHVLSELRRLIDYFIGHVLQALRNPFGSAPPDFIVVQMKADATDSWMVRQKLQQSYRNDFFPFLLEYACKRQECGLLPITTGSLFQSCVAQKVDCRLEHMDLGSIRRKAEGK